MRLTCNEKMTYPVSTRQTFGYHFNTKSYTLLGIGSLIKKKSEE
jgi:hypothetical protein